MTTPNEELIAALTQTNQFHESADICTANVIAVLQSQAERIAELDAKASATQQQAQIWQMEAATQKATVHEIYQLCTGGTGEPGDWNGAAPVRALIAERDTLRAQLEQIAATEPVAYRWVWKSKPWDIEGWCYTNTPPTLPELQEIEPLFTHPMPAQDVTELEKDAARYRWLKETINDCEHDLPTIAQWDDDSRRFTLGRREWYEDGGIALDAEIDASISKYKGAK